MPESITVFTARQDEDAAWRVTLTQASSSKGLFGRTSQTILPFDAWINARPAAAAAALGRLLQAAEDGERAEDGRTLVETETDTATLQPVFVAQLNDSEAEALGLPLATRLSLNLKSRGLIHKDGFRIDANWTRAGGAPVSVRDGPGIVRHDDRTWRIPEPLYSTLTAVKQINAAPDEPARQAALAELKRAMGDDAAANINADGIINRLRLAYASGFSLSLRQSTSGFDFDSVLFGRERLDAADEGTVIDEVEDGLLPPALAAGFARRFRSGDGSRRTYLLDDGSLLFVDPQLARALAVVRKAQLGTVDERRAFATAPQRHIATALGDGGEMPSDAARLFVETQQFSERVAGIDIWRKPVMPWIKPKPGSWLPESFGVRVGDPPNAFTIEIAPDRLADATTAAENAVREERSSFTFDGNVIPATQATLAALSSLTDLTVAATTARTEGTDAPPAILQRYFLQVRENLEEVGYAPLAQSDATPNLSPDLPVTLRSPPKPHQVTGFHWLAGCWQAGLPGVLLADDMGLGKTYQALALLAWLRQQSPHPKPVLIVAPTGLLANWRAEIARHLEPDALGRLVSAYGTSLRQMRDGAARDIDTGSSAIDPTSWANAGVVLTTYETMRDYHLSFARQPFAAILYDEAQKLKNPASQITRAAKTLNAKFQLALTGTPVENRLQDLWSIFDVIHPGLLGSSKAFEQSYPAEPGPLATLHALLTSAQAGRPPVLLRRLKEECLDSLPAKHVTTMPIVMPPRQAQAYDRVVARALVAKGTSERGRMLEVLHQLRGVSLHPFPPDEAGNDASYFANSARISALFNVLDDVARKAEKALIFCESLAMQALLAVEIRRRYALPHPIIRIHGGVAGDTRQSDVDVFQQRPLGFDVMILSPKAGGVGLTLTAANHVIHLSRWWNPAVEDQATDRAYRIGQTRDVTVYLPQSIHPDAAVAPTSFDLKLHALMERKRSLSRGLLAPGEDDRDTAGLFDQVISAEPQSIPELPLTVAPQPVPTAPPLPVRRSILQLRARLAPVVVRPAAAPPLQPAAPITIVYAAGEKRDLTIFSHAIADDPVRDLLIIDPYALAGSRARASIVEFVALLAGATRRLESVRLVTYDADSFDLSQPESTDYQYSDLCARWRAKFGDDSGLHVEQRSRRQDRNLHDREAQAITESGRSLLWVLGRGIDGVMQTRHGCRVTLLSE